MPAPIAPVLPTPHLEKLQALAENTKLPAVDLPRVQAALLKYQQWRADILGIQGSMAEVVAPLIAKLNEYKRYIDLDLIFDSPADFLYRQKGQTKIDNSIIEEFLPVLALAAFRDKLCGDMYELGPTKCISGIRFDSTFPSLAAGAGGAVRSKDQDFAIARPVFIRTSHFSDFRSATTAESRIAYIAAECKTNLDKTMFQEGAATAQDVKTAVPGAKYLLLCEWLDMTPISTSLTPIDEIIILRKAKRLSSTVRKKFSRAADRVAERPGFAAYLDGNPFATSSFDRFLGHIEKVVNADELKESQVLVNGFF